MPQNGHDWHTIPKSEKIAFCSALIFEKEGLGVYPSEKVKLAGNYFAGRINRYYEIHPLDNPMSKAVEWAYPETRKILEGLTIDDKKVDREKKITTNKSASKKNKYPTGIGSIKFGDTKRNVFNKIKKFNYITFPDHCKNPTFDEWSKNLNHEWRTYCQGTIKLFDEEFEIEWKFSKRDKLYNIKCNAFIALAGYYRIERSKEEVKNFNKSVIEVYLKKYGKPSYSNINAYPIKDGSCPYVAKWNFSKKVSVEMYVCLDSEREVIYFYLNTTDQKEFTKVKEDEKKEEEERLEREKEQKQKEMKKTKDLI